MTCQCCGADAKPGSLVFCTACCDIWRDSGEKRRADGITAEGGEVFRVERRIAVARVDFVTRIRAERLYVKGTT